MGNQKIMSLLSYAFFSFGCRLSDKEITMKDWKFSRMMKMSGLPFTEGQLLRIVELLGFKRCWKQALSVVQWVYNYKDHRKFQSR